MTSGKRQRNCPGTSSGLGPNTNAPRSLCHVIVKINVEGGEKFVSVVRQHWTDRESEDEGQFSLGEIDVAWNWKVNPVSHADSLQTGLLWWSNGKGAAVEVVPRPSKILRSWEDNVSTPRTCTARRALKLSTRSLYTPVSRSTASIDRASQKSLYESNMISSRDALAVLGYFAWYSEGWNLQVILVSFWKHAYRRQKCLNV